MSDTEDQAPEAEVGTEETQTDTSPEQSDKTESEQELYELPDGRKVPADQLSKEWKENFYPEFTRKSQRLSELEKESSEREARAKEQADMAIADNELLKNVDPDVKEAVIQIVKPELERMLSDRESAAQREEQDRKFQQRLTELEEKYPGGNGLPKFDRQKVLDSMREPGNEVFDPELKFRTLHEDEFNDALIKSALKAKKGGPTTESTTGDAPRKPESKVPTSWEEAAKSALSRF